MAVSAGGVSAVCTIDATAPRPPSTAAASFSQVERCSVERSGFVFGVAGLQGRLLRQMQRFDRGRRPAMIMLELDRPARRGGCLMWARRVDQRWFSRGSTPTISRIGRFAGSVPGRSANRTPKLSRRCCSSAVL